MGGLTPEPITAFCMYCPNGVISIVPNLGAEALADEATLSCNMCGFTVLGFATHTEQQGLVFHPTSALMKVNRREPQGEAATTAASASHRPADP